MAAIDDGRETKENRVNRQNPRKYTENGSKQ